MKIELPDKVIEPRDYDGTGLTVIITHFRTNANYGPTLKLKGAYMQNSTVSALSACVKSSRGVDCDSDSVYLAKVDFVPGKLVWMWDHLVYEGSLVTSCSLQTEDEVEAEIKSNKVATYLPKLPWRQDSLQSYQFATLMCDVRVLFGDY